MVVGITIATIFVLFRGGKEDGGATFIDPDSFRETVGDAIQDLDRRESALLIVDSMRQLVEEYDGFLRESIDIYLQRIPDFDETPAAIFEEVIRPVERKRRETLLAYVELRDELRKQLLDDEWRLVFGEPQAADG